MKKMISEILEETSRMKSRKDRIAFLREHASMTLYRILGACFDPRCKFLLPPEDPPYKPAMDHFGHSMLYSESRKLVHFLEGGNDGLQQKRRETMFIEFLESIHPKDAWMMLKIRNKKMPYPGITEALVREAFPGLLPEKEVETKQPVIQETVEGTNVENT